MTDNPSIGAIGSIYYDEDNDRVKYFSQPIHTEKGSIDTEVAQARRMMEEQGASRFTARFLSTASYESPHLEAMIPLNNGFSGVCLYYLGMNDDRRRSPDDILERQEALLRQVDRPGTIRDIPEGYRLERLVRVGDADRQRLASLYQESFPTYLTELDEEAVESMVENSIVYVARNPEGMIVSSAVGEVGQVDTGEGILRICEMSEMATDRNDRNASLVSAVASQVADEARQITDLIFSEARASHVAINRVFAKMGFAYAGRLHKHCVISGDREIDEQGPYENLHVWYALPGGYHEM